MQLLEGVRVAETGDGLTVRFAGHLLASLGASVTRFEPAGSTSGASVTSSDRHGPVARALLAYLDRDKACESVDDAGAGSPAAFEGAQIWLDGRPTAAIRETLDSGGASTWNGVHVALTPFGLDGPWAEKNATGITATALAGFMHLCGDPEQEPLRNGGYLAEFQSGLFGAVGAAAGLLGLEMGRGGSLVDVSLLESVIAYQERADIAYTHMGRDWVRSLRHEMAHPFTVFECGDGFVTLACGTPRHWANLCMLIGRPEWASDRELIMNRLARADEIDVSLVAWLRAHTMNEVVAACQELFIPCGPVLTAAQVLDDAHLREREFFVPFAVPGLGEVEVPGFPLRVTAFSGAEGGAR